MREIEVYLATFAVLALGAGAPACGGEEAPVESATGRSCEIGQCSDGCCMNGTCLPGDSIAACGVPGGLCTSCLPGSRCIEGQCSFVRQLCILVGCDGCCLDGECHAGFAQDACGAGGDPCQACTRSQVCRNGWCQTVGMPAGRSEVGVPGSMSEGNMSRPEAPPLRGGCEQVNGGWSCRPQARSGNFPSASF